VAHLPGEDLRLLQDGHLQHAARGADDAHLRRIQRVENFLARAEAPPCEDGDQRDDEQGQPGGPRPDRHVGPLRPPDRRAPRTAIELKSFADLSQLFAK
jgi:hypothetical protein